MKLINRKSAEIIQNGSKAQEQFFVTVTGRAVFFTATAAVFCNLTENTFVHFLNNDENWHFYLNDDPEGFKPVTTMLAKSKRPSFRLHSTGLVNMILKSTGYQKSKRFSIEKTELFQDRAPVFRLSLKKVSTAIR